MSKYDVTLFGRLSEDVLAPWKERKCFFLYCIKNKQEYLCVLQLGGNKNWNTATAFTPILLLRVAAEHFQWIKTKHWNYSAAQMIAV